MFRINTDIDTACVSTPDMIHFIVPLYRNSRDYQMVGECWMNSEETTLFLILF